MADTIPVFAGTARIQITIKQSEPGVALRETVRSPMDAVWKHRLAARLDGRLFHTLRHGETSRGEESFFYGLGAEGRIQSTRPARQDYIPVGGHK